MSKFQRLIAGGTLVVGIAAGFAAACPGDLASPPKQTNVADDCQDPPPRTQCGVFMGGNQTPFQVQTGTTHATLSTHFQVKADGQTDSGSIDQGIKDGLKALDNMRTTAIIPFTLV
jgi:hypothetical protein